MGSVTRAWICSTFVKSGIYIWFKLTEAVLVLQRGGLMLIPPYTEISISLSKQKERIPWQNINVDIDI